MNESKLLLVFLDVVHQGSFAKAARVRNTDPGLITKQIKQLEHQLGAILLNRSTRSMSLTKVGEQVYTKAQQVKLLLDEINELPNQFQEKVQGIIHVSSAFYIGRNYVEPAIRAVQKAHPDVTFNLQLNDDLVDIIKEGYDVAIRQSTPKDSNLIATKLIDVQLKLVASPKFIQQYGMPKTIEQLQKLPAALYRRKEFLRNKLHYFEAQRTLITESLNSRFMVNDIDLILNMTRSGNTYCFATDYMVDHELNSKKLIQLLPDLKMPPEHAIYAVYPHRQIARGAQLLIEELKARLQQPVVPCRND